MNPAHHDIRLFEFALPYPADAPPVRAKLATDLSVTANIASNLVLPELRILLWFDVTGRAPMPETTIHEHDQTFLPEDKIRFTGNGLVSPPPRDPMNPEKVQQFDFRGLVSLAANSRHYITALLPGEDVGHTKYLLSP